jgi:ribosomal protein L17
VLRTYIEPLITKAKENATHQRRVVSVICRIRKLSPNSSAQSLKKLAVVRVVIPVSSNWDKEPVTLLKRP